MPTIEIMPYRSVWSGEFDSLASVLRGRMGTLALRIDHIGSTSVPGLAAKDIIDIQVTVAALDGAAIDAVLASDGYTRRTDIVNDHIPEGGIRDAAEWAKLYYRAPDGQRPTHLHVRQAGRANQRYPLLFRDFLRAHPDMAAHYGLIKQELARLHPDDVDAYYAIKDPVCDVIIGAAEQWAAQTGYDGYVVHHVTAG